MKVLLDFLIFYSLVLNKYWNLSQVLFRQKYHKTTIVSMYVALRPTNWGVRKSNICDVRRYQRYQTRYHEKCLKNKYLKGFYQSFTYLSKYIDLEDQTFFPTS